MVENETSASPDKGQRDCTDPQAVQDVEAIVAEYEKGLLRYAARVLKDPMAAEDVVQNVFIKFFQRRPIAIGSPSALKSWLFRVVHNEAIDYLRREARLRLLHEKNASLRSEEELCDGRSMTEEEKRELVMRLIDRLHPREKQVLLLRLDNGLSYEEIAAATGRSVGNVGNILHHAVKKLSDMLARSGAISQREQG